MMGFVGNFVLCSCLDCQGIRKEAKRSIYIYVQFISAESVLK